MVPETLEAVAEVARDMQEREEMVRQVHQVSVVAEEAERERVVPAETRPERARVPPEPAVAEPAVSA